MAAKGTALPGSCWQGGLWGRRVQPPPFPSPLRAEMGMGAGDPIPQVPPATPETPAARGTPGSPPAWCHHPGDSTVPISACVQCPP